MDGMKRSTFDVDLLFSKKKKKKDLVVDLQRKRKEKSLAKGPSDSIDP